MGGVINNPPFINTFHNPSASLVGTIVTIYEIGCCAGSIITALVEEHLGRRKSIFIGAFIILGGTDRREDRVWHWHGTSRVSGLCEEV